MAAQCGLLKIKARELQLWRHQSGYRVHPTLFGPSSGYNGDETSRLVLSRAGKIWFVGGFTLYSIDPRHLWINSVPPPVQVQEVVADQRAWHVLPRLRLPGLTHNVEIDYAALSYVQPDLLTFRYRLSGHDGDWTAAGSRREAFYNDLPPGDYRFQVTACNRDGVCNLQGASIAIVIPPAWWQTWWFRTLCIVAIGTAILAAIRWRLEARDEVMRLRFDDRLEERTRVARDLHDTMMQTVLASKLLAEGGKLIGSVPEGQSLFVRLSDWLGSAADEARAAVTSLRSSTVETNHLANAFQLAALDFRPDADLEAHVSVSGDIRELHPVVRDEVYRIGVEAIRNARAHSEASNLYVTVSYAQNLTLSVRDDGRGMSADTLKVGKAGHFGMAGMHERAEHIGATLTISSNPMGTEVLLVVPGRTVFIGATGALFPLARSAIGWLRRALERRRGLIVEKP
jgi:signal transduction histidine kinase